MESTAIKVAMIDDYPLIRSGLKFMLSAEPDINVVGEYDRGQLMLQDLKNCTPDILLLDLQLSDSYGGDMLPELRRDFPKLKVIVLTANDSLYSIKKMMGLGIEGYILKNTEQGLLAQAIRVVYHGGVFFSPEMQAKMLRISRRSDISMAEHNDLTPRELEILKLIAEEHTSQEIGAKLKLSFRTVDNYRLVLMQKLGVTNMIGLLKKAIILGLIDE